MTRFLKPLTLNHSALALLIFAAGTATGGVDRYGEEKQSNDPAIAWLLARADEQLEKGDLNGANAAVERALRITPNDPGAWRRLAEVRARQGDVAQARELHAMAARLARELEEVDETLASTAEAMSTRDGASEIGSGVSVAKGALPSSAEAELQIRDVVRIHGDMHAISHLETDVPGSYVAADNEEILPRKGVSQAREMTAPLEQNMTRAPHHQRQREKASLRAAEARDEVSPADEYREGDPRVREQALAAVIDSYERERVAQERVARRERARALSVQSSDIDRAERTRAAQDLAALSKAYKSRQRELESDEPVYLDFAANERWRKVDRRGAKAKQWRTDNRKFVTKKHYRASKHARFRSQSNYTATRPERGFASTRNIADSTVRIPRGHRPPPGMCRAWVVGRPPGHQAPPRACDELFGNLPLGTLLVTND